MQNDVIVLVPIYLPILTGQDLFSLDYSIEKLRTRRVHFVAPEGMDTSFYTLRYPGTQVDRFDAAHFASVQGYSRLLLSESFYERYIDHEFLLILQTDAIILDDDLDRWCASRFDYVGAPWPSGLELKINLDRFVDDLQVKAHARVGNGGLSLRRIRACLSLLKEFPQAVQVFQATGSSEDLFFALMGGLSWDFVLPNEMTASLFSLELSPEVYLRMNGGRRPMGGHAWCKYNRDFWLPLLDRAPPPLEVLPVGVPDDASAMPA